MQKGSRNRTKARDKLAIQHSRVARQRGDNNHKLSRRLLYGHSLVGFEDLRISNMVRNHALAKSIQDAGWGQLIRFTEYKAMETGARVVRVESAYSTQECFWCGALNKVRLDQREFVCVRCGRTIKRDVNAARVVLKQALAQVGQGMPELKPVETEPLRVQTTGRASPVFEAGTEGPALAGGEGVTQGKARVFPVLNTPDHESVRGPVVQRYERPPRTRENPLGSQGRGFNSPPVH